jgi:hypothetical protein
MKITINKHNTYNGFWWWQVQIKGLANGIVRA